MVRFLDFRETLALACTIAEPFYVYGEQESPVLVAGLKDKKTFRAVLFETDLSLDVWTLALSYDISVFFPISLEELYRMLINVTVSSVIYVCREVMRMQEAYETSGFISEGDHPRIPRPISDALLCGDIERALLLYDRAEAACIAARKSRNESDISYRRGRLMRFSKKGNADVCVIVSGYVSSMVDYLLSESSSIDIVMLSGVNRRLQRELKLLAGGYRQIIWVSHTDTLFSSMISEKTLRKVTARNIHELYEKLMAALPRDLRKQLHYPGRPEEWPMHHLPDIKTCEQRMCPGCVYRSRGIGKAYCEKLGIDVYKNGQEAGPEKAALKLSGKRLPVIGLAGEECIEHKKKLYAVKSFMCRGCGICIKECGCPALHPEPFGCVIDPLMCTGCGACDGICPQEAIYSYVTP